MFNQTGVRSPLNLQELLDFHPQHPVLSLYLNTDPTQVNSDAYRLNLRNMLKTVDMPEDVAAIEQYFEHQYAWNGRSVAIFSCAAEKFFRAYPLAISVGSRVRIGSVPHVKPLVNLLDFYGGYGVALVDRLGVRLFSFHMGELMEQDGFVGEDVRHGKRGGSSSIAGQRGGTGSVTNHEAEQVGHNMRSAAEAAVHFFNEHKVRRLVLGGTLDNLTLFRGQLPKSWQSLVVGTFPMSMTASKEEVLARALEIGGEAEHRHEMRLVEDIITNAAKKHGGVLHLDSTLKAVHDGRVQILVIREGMRAPGYHCKSCGYLTAQPLAVCPFCGQSFEKIPDAVEMAVHTVMQQGGEVEVLQNAAAAEKLGGIGALLRY